MLDPNNFGQSTEDQFDIGNLLGSVNTQNNQAEGLDIGYLRSLSPGGRAVYLENMGVKGTQQRNILESLQSDEDQSSAIDVARRTRGQLENLGVSIQNPNRERTAATTGPIASLIYGTGDTDTGSSWARAVASAYNPEIGAGLDARTALSSLNYLTAYDDLRGAGQITEYEGRTAQNAVNRLNSGTLNDEQYYEEALKVYRAFDAAIKRQEENIRETASGVQYRFDPVSGEPITQVVSYYNPNTGELDVSDISERVDFPDYITRNEVMRVYEGLPPGTRYSFVNSDGQRIEGVKGQGNATNTTSE